MVPTAVRRPSRGPAHNHEAVETADDAPWQLTLGASGALCDLLGTEQVERRDVPPVDAGERLLAAELALCREAPHLDVWESGHGELPLDLVGGRKPCSVDGLDRGKERLQPVRLEVVGMERADRNAAVIRDYPPRLCEGQRTVDEVEHERHRDTVEPPVAERQPLGRALPHADACRERFACYGDHLCAAVETPCLCVSFTDEGGEQPPGPAADIQHAPATES